MKIRMQEAESTSELEVNNWDLAIVGDTLDDRGIAAKEYLSRCATQVVSIRYDEENFIFEVNGGTINAEDISQYFDAFKGEALVLETTTLGFVEIFLICRALRDLQFTTPLT